MATIEEHIGSSCNEIRLFFSNHLEKRCAMGTPRFLSFYNIWSTLKIKDGGQLVTRHLIVGLQLRLEECFRDLLNKLTAAWSQNPPLSLRPGGISPEPQFGKCVVLLKFWPPFHAFFRVFESGKATLFISLTPLSHPYVSIPLLTNIFSLAIILLDTFM